MSELLKGAPVAEAIRARSAAQIARLTAQGITPRLGIVRIGEAPDDVRYEKSIVKACASWQIGHSCCALPADCAQQTLECALREMAEDADIHGILLFRPLPKGLDESAACACIPPYKDVDGCTSGSLAGVFTGSHEGFAPCTAQAVMELLSYYQVPVRAKRCVVIGRSLVIGRPVAMLLMQADATVTICHSRSEEVPALCRSADILVTACGRGESIGADYVTPGQTVIDVGINFDAATGRLCGDVHRGEVEPIVQQLTPVPGGVGSVTTSVLLGHVVQAAGRCAGVDA